MIQVLSGIRRSRRPQAPLPSIPFAIVAIVGCCWPAWAGQGPRPVGVRGGERIAWNQAADDRSPYRFVLYVDGRESALPDVVCEASSSTDYACSGPLPSLSAGTHTLQVVAVAEYGISPRSAPLIVSIEGTATLPEPAMRGVSLGDAATVGTPLCGSRADTQCYLLESVFTIAHPISSVAPLDDGRLLFVESGKRIRVAAGGQVLPDVAMAVDRATDRIVAVIVDQAFPESRTVFVAWVDEPSAGRRSLSIARYRELQNQLGQRAIVVSELALPPRGDPQVAVDSTNHIYVAVPGGDGRTAGPYEGSLLRFAPDGTVPWKLGQTSPVVGSAFEQPTAIASDRLQRRIWLSGWSGSGEPTLRWIAEDGSSLAPASTQSGSSDVVAIAVSSGLRAESRLLVADATGRLALAPLTSSGTTQNAWSHGDLRAFALGAGRYDDVYAVTRTDDGNVPLYSVLKLTLR